MHQNGSNHAVLDAPNAPQKPSMHLLRVFECKSDAPDAQNPFGMNAPLVCHKTVIQQQPSVVGRLTATGDASAHSITITNDSVKILGDFPLGLIRYFDFGLNNIISRVFSLCKTTTNTKTTLI